MKKLNWKLIISIIFLFALLIVIMTNSKLIRFIIHLLESKYLTLSIWIFITLIAIFHLLTQTNNNELISDKKGFEKQIDYISFIVTYGTILTSIQILLKEIIAHNTIKSISKCKEINNIESITIIIVIIILIFFCVKRIKPIIIELFIIK